MAKASMGDVITIELNQDEAETLVVVLRKIGGAPDTTRRGFTDNVLKALRTIGFTEDYNSMGGYEMSGSLAFPYQWRRRDGSSS